MTGFGQAEAVTPSGPYRIEIRGVNNRYLDIQFRTPRALANLEPKLKQALTEKLSRGSITCIVSGTQAENGQRRTYDPKAVEDYLRIFREIKKNHNLAGDVTLSDLLGFTDLIKVESDSCDEEQLWKHIEPVLADAITSFQKAREREGAFIAKELKKMLKSVTQATAAIEKRAPERIKAYREELKKKIAKIIQNAPDEQRIVQEVAIMADRMDISEECTRMRSHISSFLSFFDAGEPSGRKMNFLLQEMNREANTIGSKANDSQISHLSVELKELVEKIREQIQNIE